MRKIIVTCPCGQRMQVSRSAYGKIGICPKCNQQIRVGSNGAEPLALPSPDEAPSHNPGSAPFQFQGRRNSDSEIAKRKFARAVDFFYHARYGDSLAVLDELRRDLPGNAQIETARARCLEALSAPPTTIKENKRAAEPYCGAGVPPARSPANAEDANCGAGVPPAHSRANTVTPPRDPAPPLELTAQAVHQTVLQLMTSGSTDSVRIQAAELASRILALAPGQSADGNRGFSVKAAPSNGKAKPPAHISGEPAASVKS